MKCSLLLHWHLSFINEHYLGTTIQLQYTLYTFQTSLNLISTQKACFGWCVISDSKLAFRFRRLVLPKALGQPLALSHSNLSCPDDVSTTSTPSSSQQSHTIYKHIQHQREVHIESIRYQIPNLSTNTAAVEMSASNTPDAPYDPYIPSNKSTPNPNRTPQPSSVGSTPALGHEETSPITGDSRTARLQAVSCDFFDRRRRLRPTCKCDSDFAADDVPCCLSLWVSDIYTGAERYQCVAVHWQSLPVFAAEANTNLVTPRDSFTFTRLAYAVVT